MKIKIPKINENLGIKLYSPDDKYLGRINTTMQFYDVRCQIKEMNNPGDVYYKFEIDNKMFKIDKYGRLEREAKSNPKLRIFESYLDRLMS
jgi:hypothetical protein